jgi:hypothetical protein
MQRDWNLKERKEDLRYDRNEAAKRDYGARGECDALVHGICAT